jgi:hypothetical protein
MSNKDLETKFVKPAEADLKSGRRDWLEQGQDLENTKERSLFKKVRNIVVG